MKSLFNYQILISSDSVNLIENTADMNIALHTTFAFMIPSTLLKTQPTCEQQKGFVWNNRINILKIKM